MVRLRAVHLIGVAVIVAIFLASTLLLMLDNYALVTSMLFSFLNVIGATFPPSEAMIDAQSPFVLTSVAIGGIANVAFIITFTAIFYQVLSGIDLRSALMKQKLRSVSKHVVITPMNTMGMELAKKMKENRIPVLFIDENKFMVRKALRQGMMAIHGNPSDSDTLCRANASSALALYTLYDDDIKNTFVTIEARRQGKNIKVISRIRRMENIPKVERSGVRRVILPEAAVGVAIGDFLLSKT